MPTILRHYYELNKDTLHFHTRALVDKMLQLGYGGLIPIIDWDRCNSVWVEHTLHELQEKFKLPRLEVDVSKIPFVHARQALDLVKSEKSLKGDANKIVDRIIEKEIKKRIDKATEAEIRFVLLKAIVLYRTAFQLSGR